MADYTKLKFDQIKKLIAPYPLGNLQKTTPMDGGQANSSFMLSTDKEKYILSVCDEKNMAEIQCLTQMLTHLEFHNFPTSRIISTRDGRKVITLEEKPVYIKRYIDADVIRYLNAPQLEGLGRALNLLHIIPPLKDIPGQFPYGMQFFPHLYQTGITHPYLDWLKEKQIFLTQAIDPNLPRGMIHGDIYWDNLLFSGDELAAVLDFEEACHYYLLFDLGMCAVGCCTKKGRFNMDQTAKVLAGYQQQSPLSSHEKKQLKVFMEYAAVAGSSWRFNQYNLKYPGHDLSESYLELSALADQIHGMDEAKFAAAF